MTYTKDIPRSGQSLGETRVPINANFGEIYDWAAINHYTFDTGNEGKHSRLDLPPQTTYPATITDESWVQSRLTSLATFAAAANTTELTWRGNDIAAGGDQFYLSAMPVRCSFTLTWNGMDGAQTPLGRSFNVQSVISSAAGNINTFTVTFQQNMLSVNYIPIINVYTNSTSVNNYVIIGMAPSAKLVGSLAFKVVKPASLILSTFQLSFLVLGG